MNADINLMYKRTFHPLRVNGDALHALALWLKANDPRQVRQPPAREVRVERYPAGLLSDEELLALCEVINS